MPYSERYLRQGAKIVRNYLSDVFGFDGETRWRVLDIRDENNQKIYRKAPRAAKLPDVVIKQKTECDLKRAEFAACLYTGDMNLDSDYVIFVNDANEAMAINLGEEITHGEHMTAHIKNSTRQIYGEKFSSATREFLGHLGLRCIERAANAGWVFDYSNPDVLNPELGVMEEIEHLVGYSIAGQLFGISGRVPFEELFHAGDQKAVWGVVKRHIKPRIKISIRPGHYCDLVVREYRSRYSEVLKDAGLDAELVITKRKKRK